jgi:hypothetical protein
MQDPVLGRYSFLAADPFDYFEYPAGQTDGLGELTRRLAEFPAATSPVCLRSRAGPRGC